MYTECKYGGPLRQTGPSCTKSRLARPQLFPDVLVDMNGCTRAIPQASLAGRELQTLKCKELRFLAQMKRWFIEGAENKGSASEEVRLLCVLLTCQNITPIHVKNQISQAKSSFLSAFKGSKSIKELAETKIWLILILTMCLQSTKNTKRQVKTTFQLLLMHRNQTTLSDGWSGDIKQMPFSMCAQMNNHITKSGKNIDSSKNHSVLTSVWKASTFFNLSAASNNTYFYLCC